MFHKWRIIQDLQEGSCGLNGVSPLEFSWMDWEKPRKPLFRIADAPAIERGISRIEFSATPNNLFFTYMSSIGLKLDPFEAASPLRHVSS
jgi:hypothetical protein